MDMKRGRPLKSKIRQNLIELLFFIQYGHGYDIYKTYLEIFPKVTQRSIYYHLNKGLETNEFSIYKVKKERGDYSWGDYAEKIYYQLGPKAIIKGYKTVKDYFDKLKEKDLDENSN
jgi:hypothetical protein